VLCDHQHVTTLSASRWSGEFKCLIFDSLHLRFVGRNSVVGVATFYGLDSPEIEFSTLVQIGPGAHSAPYTMGAESFPGRKRPIRDVTRILHLAPKLKKVELYLYSPLFLYVRLWVKIYIFTFTIFDCMVEGMYVFYSRSSVKQHFLDHTKMHHCFPDLNQ
jgi:hypothetical protein